MSIDPVKYAAVGTGGRFTMFADPIVRDFTESARLVALCDISHKRMTYHRERLKRDYGGYDIPAYSAVDFDRMIDTHKPDVIIICTVDANHCEYILRSVARGCNVICEKPITTDAEKCRALLSGLAGREQDVRITFNLRWATGLTQVRELVQAGTIGQIKHVQFEYLLNTSHGADYFRRWHSEKQHSGGLLVHKATHHFDLVNWIIDGIPKKVYAAGGLVFYGKTNALSRGDEALTRYDRYTDSDNITDPFRLDLRQQEKTRRLYLDAEEETGYKRDLNVFREGIDIEDSMSVIVNYRNGVILNYSLNAFSPYEGFHIHLMGDRGRIEYTEKLADHIVLGQDDEELSREQSKGNPSKKLTIFPLFAPSRDVPLRPAPGAHGGGDPLLQAQMFSAQPAEDYLGRNAGHEQGIASAIVGIAANHSIATGLPVDIESLISLKPEATRLSELI